MKEHKNLMIVGTSSGAGKSLTVAGICRIFFKDGYSVSPFKSQNMALNSFITKDGYEMGRAQVVQAMACGIEPKVFMNPILLKPTEDRKSQIIINGKSVGNMKWQDYIEYKKKLKNEIIKTYEDNIRKNYEICILEGAGSPVEINLTEDDIVNMGMAQMVNAPTLLVADIDRGGVFASIYGTVMLMSLEERKLLKGIIINKFQGDVEVLRPGLKRLEKLINIPILGVIPYSDIDIEDEDGLSAKFHKKKSNNQIKVSIIKNRRISNFNDFDPFNIYDDVAINYVTSSHELGDEDLIIIPGSKNTIEDLKDLNDKGIAPEIIRSSKRGTPIIGICGGLQMLGTKIKDPYQIESSIGEINGLGLLEIETIMEKEKNTTQYNGQIQGAKDFYSTINGIAIKGYEIHQGVSTKIDSKEPITFISNKNIFATYVHGIFDNKEFIDGILNKIREKKGLELKHDSISFDEYREKEFDKLENILRDSLDMKKIYEIMGLKYGNRN